MCVKLFSSFQSYRAKYKLIMPGSAANSCNIDRHIILVHVHGLSQSEVFFCHLSVMMKTKLSLLVSGACSQVSSLLCSEPGLGLCSNYYNYALTLAALEVWLHTLRVGELVPPPSTPIGSDLLTTLYQISQWSIIPWRYSCLQVTATEWTSKSTCSGQYCWKIDNPMKTSSIQKTKQINCTQDQ